MWVAWSHTHTHITHTTWQCRRKKCLGTTRNDGEKCFHTYLVSSGGGDVGGSVVGKWLELEGKQNDWSDRRYGSLTASALFTGCTLPNPHVCIIILLSFSADFFLAISAERRDADHFMSCCVFLLSWMALYSISPSVGGLFVSIVTAAISKWTTFCICSFFRSLFISLFLSVTVSFFHSNTWPILPVTHIVSPTKHPLNTHKPARGWSEPGLQVKFMRYNMICSLYFMVHDERALPFLKLDVCIACWLVRFMEKERILFTAPIVYSH